MELLTHMSATVDPAGRGAELGTAFGPQYRRTADLYLAHFAELGIPNEAVRRIAERSQASLTAWAPGLALEAEAIAAAAGIEPWRLAAVGGRTEILATAPPREGECSTAVHVGRGRAAESIQTWDWHDFLVPQALLLAFGAAGGMRVKTFTEFGTAAKIGVNSAGVGLHFNILSHRTDSDAGGVPVHAIARRVLEEARSIDDARDIAASADVSASTVLTVFESVPGQGSRAAALEISPDGLGVVEPSADGWLFHTNHFLDPALFAGDTMPADSTSLERLAHLDGVRGSLAGLDATARALAACGGLGPGAEICVIPDASLPRADRWSTLLTVAVDTEGFALEVYPGRPDEAGTAGFTRF